jgi:N-acetylated-alpha-linked acidic dipeptidase
MSSDEQAPLIRRVRIAASHPRKRPHYKSRFCGIAICSPILFVVLTFVFPILLFGPATSLVENVSRLPRYLPFFMPLPHSGWPNSHGLSFKALQDVTSSSIDSERIRESSRYYTSGPHLAGKNYSQALWTQKLWKELGLDTHIVSYDVYLNYPIDHRVALLKDGGKTKDGGHNYTVLFEASLEEDIIPEDPTSGLKDRVPTFHGYSANGNVTASYVFANYGSRTDYEELEKAGIKLDGKIVLAKYGGLARGLKVSGAEARGAIGVLLYSDPGDDGEITEANGYEIYPKGPARQPSSVQRGSVEKFSLAPGDPTTPGYPSKPGVPRKDTTDTLCQIPSLPISYLDAIPLLNALKGHGKKASSLGKSWSGNGLGYKGVEYWIGPTPADVVINLYNHQEYVTTPLWNVIGIINGTLPDEVVILGNHRDAWIAGGAADPNSGSAVLNEVIRGFSAAREKGWNPLRTLVFASWDGEEYGMIGSTEWVEEYYPWLSSSAVAYLNIDVAAAGPNFYSSASPLVSGLIRTAAATVQSPNQTIKGQTIADLWSGSSYPLGSGSDYVAFLDYAGIACTDFGFGGGPKDPPYMYHSNYDSFYWMENFGDPGFKHHKAVAQMWASIATSLSEAPVLPLNVSEYALALGDYIDNAAKLATSLGRSSKTSHTLSSVKSSIVSLQKTAASFDFKASVLNSEIHQDIPWYKWWKKVALYFQIRSINARLKYFERRFLFQGGLDGRKWFRHVVFAPSIDNGYAGDQFPGIVESIDKGDEKGVEKWARIVKQRVREAEASLKGGREWNHSIIV